MALQVWLPLNGDLHNQGLADVDAIIGGTAVVNANGKIGSCYKTGTSIGYIEVPASAMNGFTGDCTVCFWMKINSWNTSYATFFQAGTGGSPWNNYIFGFLRNVTSSKICFTISNGTAASNASYLTSEMAVGVWYHVALVYVSGQCSIYINGSLDKYYYTTLTPAFDKITRITLGCCNNRSGYATDAYYNDFRIYNNALSPKEIKEISQGLVCHYKLDGWLNGATENMGLKSRNFGSTAAKTNIDFGNRSTNSGDTIVRNDGFNEVSVKTAFGGICIYANSLGLKVGQKYTYSFMAYEIGCTTPNFSLYPMMYNSSGVRDTTTKMPIYVSTATTWSEANARAFGVGNLTATPKRFYCAFEWNQAVQDIIDNGGRIELSIQGHGTLGGGTIHFYAPKLEEGFNQNPSWNPSSDDTEIDKTVCFDDSGYNNSGTNSISGLSSSTDTQRHSSAMELDGVNGAITLFSGFKNIVQNPFTMNLWFKKDSIGTKAYETLIGGAAGFEMDTRANTSQTLSLYMASTRGGAVFSPFEFGQWYMVTLVNDGTNELYYINGELKKTIAKKSMPTSTYWIGAWSTATKQNYKGLISDFRLYANALSADDVKELYEVSESIDNFGNVHAYEFVEDGESVSIKKEGMVKALSIDSDPVVWLPLDGNLIDFGSLNSTVSATGATITSGKFSKAYNFDGSNDYLLGTPAPLNNSSDEWSYACWFKPTVSHKGCLYSNRNATSSSSGITIFYYQSNVYVDDGGRWNPSSKDIIVGKWNHVVITRKKGTGKYLYVNGKLSDSTSTTNNQTAANATAYLIGMSGGNTTVDGNPLNGALCDVRVYDRCLTADEVQEIYAENGFIERGEQTDASIGNQYVISNSFIER